MENLEDSELDRLSVPSGFIFPQSLCMDAFSVGVSLKVIFVGGEIVKIRLIPVFSLFIRISSVMVCLPNEYLKIGKPSISR